MEAHPTPNHLAARILAGDPDAEQELFRRYGPGIVRMLHAITQNRWSAEDYSQETFAIVLRRLRRRALAEPNLLEYFVRRTARNVVMAANRKRRRRLDNEIEGMLSDDVVDPAPGQLAVFLRDEERALVREALAAMKAVRYRQLLSRFYLQEEPKESICAEMELTTVHFNRVLFRARRSLLEVVERIAAGR
ncbi:MAG TPA: sigma-70 family RNA polymerase sigma factor [Thermoanaerobaculia bacterium]|jgi:RNA polymerase sigma-70 factor (ECF subfamily)